METGWWELHGPCGRPGSRYEFHCFSVAFNCFPTVFRPVCTVFRLIVVYFRSAQLSVGWHWRFSSGWRIYCWAALSTGDLILIMMNYVLKMMDYVFKMMNLAQLGATDAGQCAFQYIKMKILQSKMKMLRLKSMMTLGRAGAQEKSVVERVVSIMVRLQGQIPHILDHFWATFGALLGQFWGSFGPLLGQFWGSIGWNFWLFWMSAAEWIYRVRSQLVSLHKTITDLY